MLNDPIKLVSGIHGDVSLFTKFLISPPGQVKRSELKEVYRRLKEVPDKALAASGYSEINLAKLFQTFSSLK